MHNNPAVDIYYEEFMDEYPSLRTGNLITLLRQRLGPRLTPAMLLSVLDVWREDLTRWTEDAREDPDLDPDDIEANLDELAVIERRRLAVLQPR